MTTTKRRRHAEPHFNDAGGCLCRCLHCLQVRLEEDKNVPGRINLRQYCACRECTEDCPSDGRIVFAHVMNDIRTVEPQRSVQVVIRDAVTWQPVADFALPLSPGGDWSRQSITLPATADAAAVRQYNVEVRRI